MNIAPKYLIIKDKDEKTITYFEYENIDGFDVHPKPNVKIKDAINVNKVVMINSTLVGKLANKKLENKFKTLLQYISEIYEDDDEDGTRLREALNEITKLQQEAKNRYRKYLEMEEYELFKKKLGILENELSTRLKYITVEKQLESMTNDNYYSTYEDDLTKEGKSR